MRLRQIKRDCVTHAAREVAVRSPVVARQCERGSGKRSGKRSGRGVWQARRWAGSGRGDSVASAAVGGRCLDGHHVETDVQVQHVKPGRAWRDGLAIQNNDSLSNVRGPRVATKKSSVYVSCLSF